MFDIKNIEYIVRSNGSKRHPWYAYIYVDNKLVKSKSAMTKEAAEKLIPELQKEIIVDQTRKLRKYEKAIKEILGYDTYEGFSGTGHWDD